MGNTPSSPSSPSIESAHEEQCSGEDCKPEPFNPNLVGTVGYFTMTVVVCTGTQEWPVKVEKTKGTFVNSLVVATKGQDVDGVPKFFACSEPSSGDGYDLYVYPDDVKYIGIKEEDIPIFVEDQLVKGKVSTRLKSIPLGGRYHVLVCTHASRDKRCGRSGPQVLSALKDLMKEKGIGEDKVFVDGSSHVGGHKYAGVVVVFPPGDYYGYVGARNAEQVIAAYLDPKRPRANQLWRGRMGIDEDQQAKEAGLEDAPKKKKKDKGDRKEKGKEKEKKIKKEGGDDNEGGGKGEGVEEKVG